MKKKASKNPQYSVSFDIDFARNSHPGCFFALEGIDGSGKTTQAQKVVEMLDGKGIKCVYTKEPTDEPTGKMIRKILNGEMSVPPVSFQYLFSADRAVHQEHVVSHLKKGVHVITDRYFWSSIPYGMVDRGESADYLLVAYSILSMYHRFLLPDVTFFLDITAEIGMKRIAQSRNKKEIYEQKGKLEKIRGGYDVLLKRFSHEFEIVNGEADVYEISDDLFNRIDKYIEKRDYESSN